MAVGKESACNARPGFDPWAGKNPWRRAWQPTPVFLPKEAHGQRILVGYSPWGRKESDTTERLSTEQMIDEKSVKEVKEAGQVSRHPMESGKIHGNRKCRVMRGSSRA